MCKDIKECNTTITHDCDPRATCKDDIPGSFSCQCNKGFNGTGIGDRGCSDIDECTIDQPCENDSKCNNTRGSFNCFCQCGFIGKNCQGK